MSSVQLISDVLLISSALLANLFVVLYHLLTPWWRTDVGRNLQVFMIITAALLDLSAIRLAGDASLDTGWFVWIRLGVFACLPVVIGWRIWILIRLQYQARKEKADAAQLPDRDDA